MKTLRRHCSAVISLSVLVIFTLALSCTDHDVAVNLPESECVAVDGSPRLYPCEFVIESITFLGNAGAELGMVTGSSQNISLSRFLAKSNTNTGSVAGTNGAAKFDLRMRIKRVASPSFPVAVGYLLGYTHNGAGKMILHTPSLPGDTYGERTKIGSPLTLDMPIGDSRDVTFEQTFPYELINTGPTGVKPFAFFDVTSYFLDNDVTTLQFNRMVLPYFYVGSVVEAYYEKLGIRIID
ncbi:hypothetical protein SAMN04487996_101126 [Dyadobacter soli]|uniref:Uncharacterized protein n=1 Tax=Dyadobacter soli TaxID=659014 RepID=A0A1G6V541_9BACT|nr:hypothetical protein [Dyadobacter soli]SDD48127.1 hypothetical protein SAMN04487996_101126 [Dyadobacter soli]